MISRIIDYCGKNIFVVAMAAVFIIYGGVYAMRNIPLDAIPDLSDTQVIVFSEWKGRSPVLIEDQVTYPIVSKLLAAPKVKTVRAQSFFGLSFIYVIFEDGTDIYWARSRVLEYLDTIKGSLPKGVTPMLGPDATGVGWVYQYTLVDKENKYDAAYLRTLNDWYLKYWLESVPGVAEVASVGGHVKQYHIEIDPNRLRAFQIPLKKILKQVKSSNEATGARTLELAGHEYLINVDGYIKNIHDIEEISLGAKDNGVPIKLKDVATVKEGPDIRRGATDYNGLGDAVSGIVVMRFGENALNVIERVKDKIKDIQKGLPDGVEIEPVYDRSKLILESIETLKHTLFEESIIVALITTIFLFDINSALVAILTLPLVFLIAFIAMYAFGISSNIMSLGGIAISVGYIIDGSIVMVEDVHKKLEKYQDKDISFNEKRDIILDSAKALGKPLFMSLMITAVSFMPVFALEAEEGRLFHPLAYTKTFVIFFASFLAITVTPALMTLLIPSKVKSEDKNPVNRFLVKIYDPMIKFVLAKPIITIIVSLLCLILSLPTAFRLGSEFMPPLNEGTILYMPSSLPGLGITEATRMAQIQDKLIMTVPEVESAFAKVGRAKTSTDPAPMDMFETVVNLKEKSKWRPGMTWEKIIEELDSKLQIPGVTNAWTMPIKGRIDMLSTGLKTPVGIKIFGDNLNVLEKIGKQIEKLLKPVNGTRSVFSQRANSGYYLNINLDRKKLARHGINIEDVETVIESALGGETITSTVEGKERFEVIARYKREFRDSPEKIKNILVSAHSGKHQIPLSQLADISFDKGPMSIKDENASLVAYVYVDISDRDIGSYVDEAKKVLEEKLDLPTGYTIEWAGQYQFLQRIKAKMKVIVPITLFIVFILTYFIYNSFSKSLIVLMSLPFALIGSVWFMYFNDFNFSIATGVGFIALLGLANETAIVMLVFIDEALDELYATKDVKANDLTAVKNNFSFNDIKEAVRYGAVQRIRPKVMTVATTVLGFLPIFIFVGTGSDVMQRIAAPMFGGLLSSSALTLLIIPSVYLLWLKRRYKFC